MDIFCYNMPLSLTNLDDASENVAEEQRTFYTGYRVCQKTGATLFLRPITLEILNRSLPNLDQITVSSF